jgi:chemotaxis protein MotB
MNFVQIRFVMKNLILFCIGALVLTSCVPSKKYKDLLAREKACSEELASYKSSALTSEAIAKEIKSQYETLKLETEKLKTDTTNLGQKSRVLRAKYDQLAAINEELETNYTKLRLGSASETAELTSEGRVGGT